MKAYSRLSFLSLGILLSLILIGCTSNNEMTSEFESLKKEIKRMNNGLSYLNNKFENVAEELDDLEMAIDNLSWEVENRDSLLIMLLPQNKALQYKKIRDLESKIDSIFFNLYNAEPKDSLFQKEYKAIVDSIANKYWD